MRRVTKSPEPACLPALRSTPGADWSSVHGTQKQELRDALCRDHAGLCAYSCRWISPTDAQGTRVEHWEARAEVASGTFAWTNLLAVCDGRCGGDPQDEHCDRSRGAQALRLHPVLGPDPEILLRHLADGMIEADAPWRSDLGPTVLNLNQLTLKRRRKAVIDGVLHKVAACKSPGELRSLIRAVETLDAQGRLPEYQPTALYQLRRALKKREDQGQRLARQARPAR